MRAGVANEFGMRRSVGAVLAGVLALVLVGCGGSPAASSASSAASTSASADTSSTTDTVSMISDVEATDQMWKDKVADAEMYVFPYEDMVVTAFDSQSVQLPWNDPLEQGKFYKVIADVEYLNGGIAGYVNYPEIKSVSSVKEVSPFDMGLPSIKDGRYGLRLIGDYADGDVFFNEVRTMAVWKDGSWIWSYDDTIELEDGTAVCVRKGVTDEQVRAGIDGGVLSCEDYFVLPAQEA